MAWEQMATMESPFAAIAADGNAQQKRSGRPHVALGLEKSRTCRSIVLLPPMLGPVRSRKGGALLPPRHTSFGTNAPPSRPAAAGWRRPCSRTIQNQHVGKLAQQGAPRHSGVL